ncbi:hypothetical protein LJR267_004288 [Paraburkholderia hospita]
MFEATSDFPVRPLSVIRLPPRKAPAEVLTLIERMRAAAGQRVLLAALRRGPRLAIAILIASQKSDAFLRRM